MFASKFTRLVGALAVALTAQPVGAREYIFRNVPPAPTVKDGPKVDPGTDPAPPGNEGEAAVRLPFAGQAVRIGQEATLAPQATGFAGTATWDVQGLPPGMRYDAASGLISGAPQAFGTFTIRVTARSGTTSAQAQAGLTVAPALAVAPVGSLSARVGVPFSHLFTATGVQGDARWSFETTASGHSASGGRFGFTPTGIGEISVTARVTDALPGSGSATATIGVTGPVPTLPATAAARVGVPFTMQASATGLLATPTWSLAEAPGGMTIDGGGAIAWVPSQVGTVGVQAQVVDADGSFGVSGRTVVTVAPAPLTAASGTLQAEGKLGQAISAVTASASGGTAPYTYALAGSVPPGLGMSGSLVEGVPTAIGTYTFHVVATDAAVPPQTAAGPDLTIVVTEPAPIVAFSPAATSVLVTRGQPIAPITVTATGGKAPVTVDVDGALPPNLIWDPETRTLYGTPGQAGSFSFRFVATDSFAPTRQTGESKTITINVADPLAIATTDLPAANLNVAYSQTLSASGGTGTLTWAAMCSTGCAEPADRLPVGLSLDRTTGVLSGTPGEAGTFTPLFKIVDQAGRSTEKRLTLVVASAAGPASNALIAAVTTTAEDGYLYLNGTDIRPFDATALLGIANAVPTSYSFYGLHNSRAVVFRYSQPVKFTAYSARLRHITQSQTIVIETSADGSAWTQVHTVAVTATMSGSVNDTDAGGRMITINAPLTTQTTGSYVRVRVTGGSQWLGIGPGGFN